MATNIMEETVINFIIGFITGILFLNIIYLNFLVNSIDSERAKRRRLKRNTIEEIKPNTENGYNQVYEEGFNMINPGELIMNEEKN